MSGGYRATKGVVKLDDLKNLFLGVIAELIAHFLIRKIEEKPNRKGQAKHMRKG